MSNVAIIFPPFLNTTNELPLAPAILTSLLDPNIYKVAFFDLNVTYQTLVNSLSELTRQELFNLGQSTGIFDLSGPASRAYVKWLTKSIESILDSETDIVLVSVFSFLSHKFVEDICFALKHTKPSIKIIVGGQGANTFLTDCNKMWYEEITHSGLVDVACIGDAEIYLQQALTFKNNIIVGTQQSNENLNKYPIPDFSLYQPSQYGDLSQLSIPITSSKGCVKKCSFCDVESQWPKFRVVSGDIIAKKMIQIREATGIRRFRFTDNLINGNVRELRKMAINLIENSANVEYFGNFIFRSEQVMPEDDFEKLRASGFKKAVLGLESGSEKVRADMRKGFCASDFTYTTSQLFKNNIAQDWNIFVGYPTETEDDFNQTLFTVEYYSNKFGPLLRINPVGIFQAINGSPIVKTGLYDLEHQYINGHTEINWTSHINPANTLLARINRWERLIALLIKTNNSNKSINDCLLQTKFYRQVLEDAPQSPATLKIIPIKQKIS